LKISFSKTGFLLLSLAAGYLFFVIYGSLVPLEFRARAFAEAWQDYGLAFCGLPAASFLTF